MRKHAFCICICQNKAQISCAVTVAVIVQYPYFLNPKFQVLWLYSLVCVRPGTSAHVLIYSPFMFCDSSYSLMILCSSGSVGVQGRSHLGLCTAL